MDRFNGASPLFSFARWESADEVKGESAIKMRHPAHCHKSGSARS